MKELSIVTFRNRTDVSPKVKNYSWEQLKNVLTTHTERREKDSAAWSPVCYREGTTRENENVTSVCCLVLDFDDGEEPRSLYHQWKNPAGQPLTWCLHSSYSSTPEHPKYRVTLPLSRPVAAADWPLVYRKLTLALAGGHADPSCKDLARIFYLPACSPTGGSNAFTDFKEGVFLNPDDFPDPEPEAAAELQMRYVFRKGTPAPQGGGDGGGGRPGDDFNGRGDALDLLVQRGWGIVQERGGVALLRRPGKTSDYSATFGYGGTNMFYCFTSSAPPFESNCGYSPFGVYAMLKYGGDYKAAAKGLRAEGYGGSSPVAPMKTMKNGQKAPVERIQTVTAAMVDGLPMVETNGRHLRDESTDALGALIKSNEPPAVFVRGGELARVQINEKNRAIIKGLTLPMLRGHFARCANFVSTSEKRGVVPVAPPKDVVEDVLAMPEWGGIPPLTGIVTAPVFSANGNLDTRPGYHPCARLFYHETCPIPIPDTSPTPENVRRARSLILEDLLGDFPFADDASRAHAVALLLLPFVRPMVDGPTPLHLIDAPSAGTGKGLLARVCTLPFTAAGAPVKAPPTEEAEWSKTLTSVFSDGDSHLLFDNVRSLNSPSFFAALTSTLYKDRLLSTNRTAEFENRLVWLATCNNIQGNDELTRRSIWIRLDAGIEQPEARDGFQHPDLAEWALANRGALIGAALTLVRAWVQDGQPAYAGKERPLGSFEAWTRVLGGILSSAGIEGFLANREEQRSRVDTDTTAWHGFVEAWRERHEDSVVVTADLFPIALEWMPEKLGDGTDKSQKSKFGRLLVRYIDKVFAGHKIITAGKATTGGSKNSPQYRLEPVEQEKTGRHGRLGRLFSLPHVVVSENNNNILYRQAGDNVSQVSHVSLAIDAEVEKFKDLI